MVPEPFDFPLRAIHASGNYGTNELVIGEWEARGRTGPLIPPDYIAWLNSLHANWIGLGLSVYYDDSMDSTLERVTSPEFDISFPDDVLRQLIREFRSHGINVYLTLNIDDTEAATAPRPAHRYDLGDPGFPGMGVPYGSTDIKPEFWPWRPDHPDHERFVAEFWETYTQQAVHYARIAEEEGVGLYSLGTETESLFRTRSGGEHWVNDFGQDLREMVSRVRAVYSGRLTYDMHYSVITADPHVYLGSHHLWEDLDLDIVGISAYFPLTDSVPTTVLSVVALQASYERIFQDYLIPLAERNPDRPIVFLEYGALDTVEAPAEPGGPSGSFQPPVFIDADGNGLDDGRETQANMFQALFNTMSRHPGILNGAFFWDNWISSEEIWQDDGYWVGTRTFSLRGRLLAEEVVRTAYEGYKNQ